MVKRAKEMFEELGYNKIDAVNPFTEEIMDWNYRYLRFDGTTKKEIHINSQTKLIFLNNSFDGTLYERANTPMLTFEELKAINKQVEELGWLDVKD